MPIATFRGENSLGELADKLFARLTPRQRDKAETALLKANPQLADLSAVSHGTVIQVPDLPELRPKARRTLENSDARILDTVSQAVTDYAHQAGPRFAQAAEALKVQDGVLSSGELKKALGRIPALQALAGQLVKQGQTDLEALKAQEQALQSAMKRMAEDLKGMV